MRIRLGREGSLYCTNSFGLVKNSRYGHEWYLFGTNWEYFSDGYFSIGLLFGHTHFFIALLWGKPYLDEEKE